MTTTTFTRRLFLGATGTCAAAGALACSGLDAAPAAARPRPSTPNPRPSTPNAGPSTPNPGRTELVHPGLLHGIADLDRMRTAVEERREPIYSGFKVMAADARSSHSYP